ncbi:amidophosphoribosyltransferase [Aerococcus sanguinicola]|uniref:Amidophosphoribosyltransferase n=1 Tax=Aerococcus sanguinicola TaxID=119206 RepID=A0A2I1MJM5_9LACT|nr:amidophosphoribosyltransferase [Aerococcus sanguinicola]
MGRGLNVSTECHKQIVSEGDYLSTYIDEAHYDLPHEECGLIGIWNHSQASRLVFYGLMALQHRGQEGAGITALDSQGQMKDIRGLGLVSEIFKAKDQFDYLQGRAALGHVRYATSGEHSLHNIQPFLFHFEAGDMALAHNGNLVNGRALRRDLEKKGAIFRSTSDSEVLMHLIRHSQEDKFLDQVKDALNQIKGGFTYILLTDQALIGACDPNGFRPLVVGQLANGSYAMASESCALDQIGAEALFDVQPGELIVIDSQGIQRQYYTADRQQAICSMEYIYFARPDSTIHDINVHTARKQCGARLAQEAPAPGADFVVGVPNSSLSAASGYAEAAQLPNEMALVKNQYVGRTFIQPSQEERERGVRMKLSAVRKLLEGKRVVMVDDSIVRGTTSKRIVSLLREAGAKEVHVRIACPPLKYPCFYGIDISTTRELIAANHDVDEICDLIGADSLAFLSEEGLMEGIGLESHAPYGGLCMAYFNGDYPTGLYDYAEEYYRALEEREEKHG